MMPQSRHDSRDDRAVPLDAELLRAWPLPLDPDGDKHSRGTVLVVGGSDRTPGAALLAGVASLRIGAGRLCIATAAEVAGHVGVAVPEAMVVPIREVADDSYAIVSGTDAVVVGPGLLDVDATTSLVADLVCHVSKEAVVVLDALALSVFPSIDAERRERLRGRLVLTPNRQEVDALAADLGLGSSASLMDLADATGAVIASFDRVVAPDGKTWCCSLTVPGLGTSGSGDVLAGLVGGAAARGGDAAQAAGWATYVHCWAGYRLGQRVGEVGYLARELIDEAPVVVGSVTN
jgi:hydroxyethylthiazole kinase-like uncharacterized protein yjeF